MKITEVKIYPAKESGTRLKAYATIVFENAFIVRDLKVIEGEKGLFVSMPSRRRKDGSFRDIAHPLNGDMRKHIEESIINEYKSLEKSGRLNSASSESDDYSFDNN
jgi:stage V sporulation protein G